VEIPPTGEGGEEEFGGDVAAWFRVIGLEFGLVTLGDGLLQEEKG
jgi:hypothetical protein